MRALLTCLALLAACGDDGDVAPTPDAGGPLDGVYVLTWTCTSGCAVAPPPVTASTSLTIAGRVLAFTGGEGATHLATGASEHCLGVPAATEPGRRERDAYQICRTELTATADVRWVTVQSPTPTVWHLQAVQ